METTIRPLVESDIPGHHRCLDVVAPERRYLAFLEAPPLDDADKYIRGQLGKGAPIFVAMADGSLVGWCDVSPLSIPVMTHRGTLGMGVHPNFRGQGIGRRLIEATLAAAPAVGVEVVSLRVRTDNVAAIALYLSVGFVVEGTQRRALRIDACYHDTHLMALQLV